MCAIYLIPDKNSIEESMALAREWKASFEYQDFFLPDVLDDKKRVDEIIALYTKYPRDRRKDFLHGAFLDVTVHSEDWRIREISHLRVQQSIDIAERLGIKGVIFHTNYIPNFKTASYQENWLQKNGEFWKKVLKQHPTLDIYLENMFDSDPYLLKALAEYMAEEERFGICFDYAHASVFGEDPKKWIDEIGPYIRHIHINDNDLQRDLHQPVGQGCIDWKNFTKQFTLLERELSVLIEVSGVEKQRVSLDYIRTHGIYPVNDRR